MQTSWQKSPLIWREGTTEYISAVFSWDLPTVKKHVRQQTIGVEKRVLGGPAVNIRGSEYFKDWPVEAVKEYSGVLQRYNPLATRTSRGCPNGCSYCYVDRIHPQFEEFKEYPVLPIICDDNLLACSQEHFDGVIDRLKSLDWCDFNQGLDVRLLTQYHADRLAELKKPIIRLAWDGIRAEKSIISAVTMLRKAKIPRKNIQCYVLMGYCDEPKGTLYRLETLWHGLGIKPNPMRYQPHTLIKNEHVGKCWTHKELDRFMSYWSNLRYTAGVPFAEYEHHPGKTKPTNQGE